MKVTPQELYLYTMVLLQSLTSQLRCHGTRYIVLKIITRPAVTIDDIVYLSEFKQSVLAGLDYCCDTLVTRLKLITFHGIIRLLLDIMHR